MTRDEILNFAKENKIKLSITWWESDGEIWLNKIIIPKKSRGQHLGSKIIDMLKQYCDEKGIVMKLLADSCYGTEIDKLMNFYKKQGLKPYKEPQNKRNPHYLKYTPKDLK